MAESDVIVFFFCRLYPASNPKVSVISGLPKFAEGRSCYVFLIAVFFLLPHPSLQLWGLPHPAWAGLFPAEQPALWTAELWWLQPNWGHFRLWSEHLWFLRTDPEQ